MYAPQKRRNVFVEQQHRGLTDEVFSVRCDHATVHAGPPSPVGSYRSQADTDTARSSPRGISPLAMAVSPFEITMQKLKQGAHLFYTKSEGPRPMDVASLDGGSGDGGECEGDSAIHQRNSESDTNTNHNKLLESGAGVMVSSGDSSGSMQRPSRTLDLWLKRNQRLHTEQDVEMSSTS